MTGSSGFIGSRVVRRLAAEGDAVVCFDAAPGRAAPAGGEGSPVTVRGDVGAVEELIEAILAHGVEAIVHLAYLLGPEVERRPHASMRVNVLGTSNVLEAARLAKVRRVVWASSIAVYGPQSAYGDRAVTEEDEPHPYWVYGGQKLFNEFMARKYRELFGLEVVAVRGATVYGHGRETGWGAWHSQVVSLPAVGLPVRVPLHPEQRWPFVYVDDVAELFVRVLKAATPRHPLYLTGGETRTMAEVARIVREFIPGAEIEFDPGAAFLPNLHRVDGSRAEAEFGFRRRSLREGIRAQIEEARRHRRGGAPREEANLEAQQGFRPGP